MTSKTKIIERKSFRWNEENKWNEEQIWKAKIKRWKMGILELWGRGSAVEVTSVLELALPTLMTDRPLPHYLFASNWRRKDDWLEIPLLSFIQGCQRQACATEQLLFGDFEASFPNDARLDPVCHGQAGHGPESFPFPVRWPNCPEPERQQQDGAALRDSLPFRDVPATWDAMSDTQGR